MRRRLWATVVSLALGYALWPGPPALAGYGAIAWDRESGRAGWVWNQPTPQKAAAEAIGKCGASSCKVIIRTAAKQCAAIATTADGKTVGAAARETQDAARMRALADCRKRKAGDCLVRASDCNK